MPHPPLFSFSVHLPNIHSARQLCIADKTQEKSYLSADWARTKTVCRQIGLERKMFVGRLGSNENCLSVNWVVYGGRQLPIIKNSKSGKNCIKCKNANKLVQKISNKSKLKIN